MLPSVSRLAPADFLLAVPQAAGGAPALQAESALAAASPQHLFPGDPSGGSRPDPALAVLRAAGEPGLLVPEHRPDGVSRPDPEAPPGSPALFVRDGNSGADEPGATDPLHALDWLFEPQRDPDPDGRSLLFAEQDRESLLARPDLLALHSLAEDLQTRLWESFESTSQGDSVLLEDTLGVRTKREGNSAGAIEHAANGNDSGVALAITGNMDGSGIAGILAAATSNDPSASEETADIYAALAVREPVLWTTFDRGLVEPQAELTPLDNANPALVATFLMAGADAADVPGSDDEGTERALMRFVIGLDPTPPAAPAGLSGSQGAALAAEQTDCLPWPDRVADQGASSSTALAPPGGSAPAAPPLPAPLGQRKEPAGAEAGRNLRQGRLVSECVGSLLGALLACLAVPSRVYSARPPGLARHPRVRNRGTGGP